MYVVVCMCVSNSNVVMERGGKESIDNLPAMWETWVQSLGWEDILEEGMATHSSILAWRIPIDRGAWWAVVHGFAKNRT